MIKPCPSCRKAFAERTCASVMAAQSLTCQHAWLNMLNMLNEGFLHLGRAACCTNGTISAGGTSTLPVLLANHLHLQVSSMTAKAHDAPQLACMTCLLLSNCSPSYLQQLLPQLRVFCMSDALACCLQLVHTTVLLLLLWFCHAGATAERFKSLLCCALLLPLNSPPARM